MRKPYDYVKMNEMETILKSLNMPLKLSNSRTILTLLAIAGLSENSRWNKTREAYLRIHDMIVFINEHYPNKGGTDEKRGGYKENSRETIRDDTVTPLCDLAILEHNGEKSQSEKNGYRLTKEFAILLKAFASDSWSDDLEYYKATHASYSEKYSQMKQIDKGMMVVFKGEEFNLARSQHNKLQKSILDDFVPRFVPGSTLLYLGDTKKRELKKDTELIAKLNIEVLERLMLPDIILYDENQDHKWIVFIEAYTSTGELTIERVSKIKEYCRNCPSDVEIIFVTAFATMQKCKEKFLSIAWDTEIWIAEEPTHMVHKNGNKFINAHSNKN